jgi:hypothetical protein
VGLPYQQTSYSDTGETTVVNQTQDVYNGYGQLTGEYQAASGTVNTSSTPEVQYVYSQPSGANYSRMSAMIYPNGHYPRPIRSTTRWAGFRVSSAARSPPAVWPHPPIRFADHSESSSSGSSGTS